MAKMPDEGVFTRGKIDQNTGAQWVYVTAQMARAHPKGRLSIELWLVVAYFVAVAAVRVADVAAYGQSGAWIVYAVQIGIPLLLAALIALRAPWSASVAIVLVGLGVVASLKGLEQADDPLQIFNIAVLIGIAVYLHYGDRPNLIYRHRYRSYAPIEGEDQGGA